MTTPCEANMELSTLYNILVRRDQETLNRYIESILVFLKATYGDVLFSLYACIRTTQDPDSRLLSFLFTLNHEPPLQTFLLEESPPDLRAKTKCFFSTLHVLTEKFLDHGMSRTEYLNAAKQAWLLA